MGNNYNNYFNNHQEHEQNNDIIENQIVETENNTIETEDQNIGTPITESMQPEIAETPITESMQPDTIETDLTSDIENIDETIDNINEQDTVIQNVRVNAKALNIRKEPNKDSDIVTIVYKDELLILCESTNINGFYKIKTHTGFDGYCMEQFVDLI